MEKSVGFATCFHLKSVDSYICWEGESLFFICITVPSHRPAQSGPCPWCVHTAVFPFRSLCTEELVVYRLSLCLVCVCARAHTHTIPQLLPAVLILVLRRSSYGQFSCYKRSKMTFNGKRSVATVLSNPRSGFPERSWIRRDQMLHLATSGSL